jgi:Fe-Mn family superoxide dismutase
MSSWKEKYDRLVEAREDLVLEPLTYGLDDLDPVLSRENLNFHYNKLARGYVTRYNSKEGDSDFNQAGAYLHNVFFSQFGSPKRSNQPKNSILKFIEQNFSSYEQFQEEVEKVAMAIQGSGWVYLSKSGDIKTIVNHQVKKDILLLIDWWEHVWYPDYGPDKKAYLKNFWKIVDWEKITIRLD